MNQTKNLLILLAMLGVFITQACASLPAQPPAATSPAPVLTVMVQPEVSTSLPAESTSVGGIRQVPSETPSGPSAGGEKMVTLDDRGKTINLAIGENFLLNLGDVYTWDISISDESVISRVKNITVIRGAQGLYKALKPGTATLTATGDPLCRQSQPPCAMPSIMFQVTMDVK